MMLMKTKVYDCSKKDFVREIDLNKDVFDLSINNDLIAQVYYVYHSNQRKSSAHAKGRGQVSGGGRKPWKQKGTGRARHGSIRSPLWVGGGIAFSPSNVNWKRKINKKMVKLALKQVLSKKLADNELIVFDCSCKSNKDSRNCIKDLVKSSSTIVITDSKDLRMAIRNLESVSVLTPKSFNMFNVVNAEKVLISMDALNNIIERLL